MKLAYWILPCLCCIFLFLYGVQDYSLYNFEPTAPEIINRWDPLQNAQSIEIQVTNNTTKPQVNNDYTMKAMKDKENEKVFKILPLTTIFKKDWFPIKGRHYFHHCAYSNCAIEKDNDSFYKSDIVMVSAFDVRNITKWTNQRKLWQKWIIYNIEPTPKVAINMCFTWEEFSNIFNATMTYLSTSSIHIPYGRPELLRTNESNGFELDSVKSKTKLVAWFVSHCNAASGRDDYARELQKYISVDIYGKCGNKTCLRDDIYTCNRMLTREYKFYLAFENTLCVDYSTEKLWRILKLHVVPVVLGGSNYAETLPPNSYLDVRNFSSPRHLAEFMLKLDRDDALFEQYFMWKYEFKIRAYWEYQACELCKFVNENANKTNLVSKSELRWDEEECYTKEEFYRDITDNGLVTQPPV